MPPTDLLELPDDTDAYVDGLSEDQVREQMALVFAIEQERRWATVAASFPKQEGWPPDYKPVLEWRETVRALIEADPPIVVGAKGYYRKHLAEFIDHWCITYDPRNAGTGRPARMPFILFERQRELVEFFLACLKVEENGLVEKSRDMGATWVAASFSIGLWLFWPGSSVGWGSRKEQLVDRLGDPDSIFEKMRMTVRSLPPAFLPRGFNPDDHMTSMKFLNPETDATITGEAGKNIGRGGRKLLMFKDESAHYEQPEVIEAALADNTRVQMDISSVNGTGNVFHRRREAGRVWIPGTEVEKGKTALFIMDWRQHPAKTEEWYKARRQKAEDEGLMHVFAQEVDRDYSAAVEGTIIPADWVKSAVGARARLGIPDRGAWRAGLDVADEGGDTNALILARGIEVKTAEQWGARDVGITTRKAVDTCAPLGELELQYDSIGVGAGVKSEANRLEALELMPSRLRLVPWNAGAAVQDPDEPIIPGDMDSPLNGDFYYNWKAQAWWRVRQRFERTHRAIVALEGGEPFTYEPDDLISIDPDIPLRLQLEKELSQPTASRHTNSQKMIVNKTPSGTNSPNLADALVMAFNPLPGLRAVYNIAAREIEQAPFTIPAHWLKGFALRVEPTRVSALWGAWDKDSDVLYITSEHIRADVEPSQNALAVKARGAWMPGFVETDSSNVEEIRQTLALYASFGLPSLMPADRAIEAGVSDMLERASTGRLKAFASCTEFFKAYRAYRRDESGKLLGGGLIDCARILCRPATLGRMIVKPADKMLAGKAARNPYRGRGG